MCYFLLVPPRGEDRHRIGVFGIYLPVLARKPGALRNGDLNILARQCDARRMVIKFPVHKYSRIAGAAAYMANGSRKCGG